LRLTLSRGSGPRGLAPPDQPAPTLLITAAAIGGKPPAPARAVIVTTRRNEHSPLAGLKSLNYLDNLLSLREAREKGADEAILLNTAGRLACASAANLFLVEGERLLTPAEREGVLPGVTRAALLEIARGLGLAVEETGMPPSTLGRAEEAFLTNSLLGIRPLVEIDGRPVKEGRIGPMTLRLRQAYAASTSAD
ncbi:MAG: aminotransferase class IV, partial [Geminicoccales bacterium]